MPRGSRRDQARRGAAERLSEIQEEAREILAAFPDLHRADLARTEPIAGRSLHEVIPGDRRRRPRHDAAAVAPGRQPRTKKR